LVKVTGSHPQATFPKAHYALHKKKKKSKEAKWLRKSHIFLHTVGGPQQALAFEKAQE
jgi:hypothetical protein